MHRGLFALLSAAASASGAVWTQNPGNGHWYAVVDARGLIWEEAKVAAEVQYGGHLATITSQAEQDWINANLLPDSTQPAIIDWGLYIGMRQDPWDLVPGRPPTMGWTWVTGEPWGYTNWSVGVEPNDAAIAGEDVGMLWATDRGTVPGRPPGYWVLGTWNDFYRFNNMWAMGAIVEREPASGEPVIPEPSSSAVLALAGCLLLRRRIR